MEVLTEIGLNQVELGTAAQAVQSLQEALSLFERLQPLTTPARADALVGLGRAMLATGRPVDALPPLEEAYRFWTTLGTDNRWASDARLWLERCRAALAHKAVFN